MAVAKVECPECGVVLKPTKPLTPGKKVRCPKCSHVFTVPGAEEEAPLPNAAVRKAEDAPLPKKAAAKPKPAAAPAPKKPAIDDDDDGGTYGLLKEPGAKDADEDEEDKKPKINYAPDLTVTDPRGPATAVLALPSNWIMLIGALICVGSIVGMAIATWPFMFTERGTSVTPLDARKEYTRRNPPKQATGQPPPLKVDKDEAEPEVKYEDLKEPEIAVFDEMKEEETITRVIWAVAFVLLLVFGLFMSFSSVKMTNLESYNWSMACSIMAMVSIIAAPFGVIALTALKRDDIKEAFEYVPE